MHFNIILQSTLRSSKRSLIFNFIDYVCGVCIFHLPYACYMARSSHSISSCLIPYSVIFSLFLWLRACALLNRWSPASHRNLRNMADDIWQLLQRVWPSGLTKFALSKFTPQKDLRQLPLCTMSHSHETNYKYLRFLFFETKNRGFI